MGANPMGMFSLSAGAPAADQRAAIARARPAADPGGGCCSATERSWGSAVDAGPALVPHPHSSRPATAMLAGRARAPATPLDRAVSITQMGWSAAAVRCAAMCGGLAGRRNGPGGDCVVHVIPTPIVIVEVGRRRTCRHPGLLPT